jgi:hypothetical protein
VLPSPAPTGPIPEHRSTRINAGQRTTPKYHDVFLSQASIFEKNNGHANLVYLAELATDMDSGDIDIIDPHVYAAKHLKNDPYSPNMHQAMHGDFVEQYTDAMKSEIASLIQQHTSTPIPRAEASRVINIRWVFKLKRLPDGTPLKFKARLCVRGDLQTEGEDYFKTYAPVVQWSTIHLLLTLILQEGWAKKHIDYTNAFTQAEIHDETIIEPPKLFGSRNGKDRVLRLLKSLYGLKQAPRTFFQKLDAGIKERGFAPSTVDPCLFVKAGCVCVVYVDDTIFAGPDSARLEAEIKSLGV